LAYAKSELPSPQSRGRACRNKLGCITELQLSYRKEWKVAQWPKKSDTRDLCAGWVSRFGGTLPDLAPWVYRY